MSGLTSPSLLEADDETGSAVQPTVMITTRNRREELRRKLLQVGALQPAVDEILLSTNPSVHR